MPGQFFTNQDYTYYNVRTAAILTNSYVAGNIIGNTTDFAALGGVHLQNQLVLLVNFTIGSLTSASIKIEFSPDNTSYYQEASSSIAAGTDTVSLLVHTLTASGLYRLAIPIKDRFIKVSAVGTGTLTNSTMTINAVFGVS